MPELIAHWPLTQDAKDAVGSFNARNHGVEFMPEGYGRFDGRGGHIVVPGFPRDVFDKPFTISAHVHTSANLDDVLGDLLSKYDPATRKGLNLCVQNFHGVTSSQSNYRNLFFGLDNGADPAPWENHGRLGNAVLVWSLCVHDGDLFASTFEIGKDESGHVFRFRGGTEWEDCGSPFPSNSVSALAVHDGKLYAAASHYRSGGSSLPASENTLHGGRVFRYEGGTAWTDCGKLGESEAIMGLASFDGKLYASSLYAPAALFVYEGGQTWKDIGTPGGRVEALGVWNGGLFGTGYDQDHAGIERYVPGRGWTSFGTPADTTQTYSLVTYRGRLYTATWPSGKVFQYAGDAKWADSGRLGEELEVMPMMVYNGKLYAGTLPLAEVYRYDSGTTWTRVARLDHTPDVKYRRAWSMAVYKGRLFCGTLPSGRVHSMEVGRCATHDAALAPGWRHVAAVRDDSRLRLYVDGVEVAASTELPTAGYEVASDAPLRIGFGEMDYFFGGIKDIRIVNGALSAGELTKA